MPLTQATSAYQTDRLFFSSTTSCFVNTPHPPAVAYIPSNVALPFPKLIFIPLKPICIFPDTSFVFLIFPTYTNVRSLVSIYILFHLINRLFRRGSYHIQSFLNIPLGVVNTEYPQNSHPSPALRSLNPNLSLDSALRLTTFRATVFDSLCL